MKIALAQANSHVGKFQKNIEIFLQYYQDACAQSVDLLVFPELFLSGYLIQDLALSGEFIEQAESALNHVVNLTLGQKCAVLMGCPVKRGGQLFNAAVLIYNGKIIEERYKIHLPNYDVFSEPRIFANAPLQDIILFNGMGIGILICEDIWYDDTVTHLSGQGANILIAMNASPFDLEKQDKRMAIIKRAHLISQLPILYVNRVGADDYLVFDGGTAVIARHHSKAVYWDEVLLIVEYDYKFQYNNEEYTKEEHIYNALMSGLYDYAQKNGFIKVVLGLSGGIDSALVAALAVDVFGGENVHCVAMPSMFSSQESLQDAEELVRRLQCQCDIINIEKLFDGFIGALADVLRGQKNDVTEENLQARIRGVLLMAISNKNKSLLLSTGNKSENAVGYATLYGDMCGGIAPISDLYKTQVYDIVRWRNGNIPKNAKNHNIDVIPLNIINKAPTAELAPGQKDQDTLPPYDILDCILHGLIECNLSTHEIAARFGLELSLVQRIAKMLKCSEFKRQQAAIGIKISTKMLSYDRLYSVTY